MVKISNNSLSYRHGQKANPISYGHQEVMCPNDWSLTKSIDDYMQYRKNRHTLSLDFRQTNCWLSNTSLHKLARNKEPSPRLSGSQILKSFSSIYDVFHTVSCDQMLLFIHVHGWWVLERWQSDLLFVQLSLWWTSPVWLFKLQQRGTYSTCIGQIVMHC